MAGAGLVPQAIVLALGAGALGGADALRLLLQFAGRISPAVDLAICIVVISLLTAPLLGTMLLARFVRKAGPGGGGATATPATDLFARMTATVSVGAALLVTACLLLLVPGGAVRLPIDFAVVVKNLVLVTAVLAICAAFAFAAAGYLPVPGAVHLRARRFFRRADSVGRPAPAAPATAIKIVVVFLVAVSSSLVASGGFDAHARLLVPEFHWRRRRRMVTMPVGVAVVTVAGITLLVRCSRRGA
ncbi:uncharacterized protein LOC8070744 [Sorghum bicolor]|nr:uncharacterized protein LOC8070744 [Sorghum bicolor]|eukprot:XP_002438021.1 uncharacterized protein LOC8070744 [Sorghum bicolor]